uniref:NADH-ubiquinone oxidoreductase chain 5 n=1 Tax=Bathymodiolus securiformis TaxID=268470 RepID=A0A384WHZ7_9BIVA|nr:NADH dehydrogenase subunit 5 [Bathymodiolus securiformis]ATB19144.1 NADH dehydrogenase subunit 5 [Bathymodiolus securiformis]
MNFKVNEVLGCIFMILGWGTMSMIPFFSPLVLVDYSIWLSGNLSVNLTLLLDQISGLFMATIFLISGSVLVYCSWYMADEIYFSRFIYLVVLFVLSMMSLIMIPNLIALLLGWDGLGITSFLLVVYYQNNKSLGAGMVTALTNRVGDSILLCIIGVFASEGGWVLFEFLPSMSYFWVPFLLVMAAITKSAQVPYSAWLPAAMAAPTPVSALVHSSTLVTAGVYLLIRSYPLLSQSDFSLSVLKCLSLFTLLMAGSVALVEVDLKKIVALSTLSQLSMMLFAISICLPKVAFFHLVTHAMFKSLLFLSAGVVIHSSSKWQDIRFLGKNWARLPVSMSCITAASLSLCGMPFLSGFYSKDLIIEMSFQGGDSLVIYFMLVVGTLFTSWYSLRLMFNLFLSTNKSVSPVIFVEEDSSVKFAYMGLLVSSVVMGFLLVNLVSDLDLMAMVSNVEKFVVMLLVVLAVSIIEVSAEWKKQNKFLVGLYGYLASMWHFKPLLAQFSPSVGLKLASLITVSMEKGWLEKVGPQGVFSSVQTLGFSNQKIQSYHFLKTVLSLLFSLFLLIILGSYL